MSRGRNARSVTYADLALHRFRNWPLKPCRAECPPGRALSLSGLQIVHFHQGDLAEVFLTHRVIGDLTSVLTSSGRVDIPPDTGWIQVHLDTDGDVFLLQSLVSLAIQANDPFAAPHRPTITACPFARPTIRRRRKPVVPDLIVHGSARTAGRR